MRHASATVFEFAVPSSQTSSPSTTPFPQMGSGGPASGSSLSEEVSDEESDWPSAPSASDSSMTSPLPASDGRSETVAQAASATQAIAPHADAAEEERCVFRALRTVISRLRGD
jgi:hypothetical protein